MTRQAATSVPIHPLLAERWSPRAFESTQVGDEQLAALFEAARWAPSAGNTQPWRFVVARQGEDAFKAIYDGLAPGNQTWAGAAPVLIVAVAQTAAVNGFELTHAAYDLGAAVAHLSVQAHHEGLHVHQLGGFDAKQVSVAIGLPDGFRPLTVIALGVVGDPDELPDQLRERELGARTRRPLDETVFDGVWDRPAFAAARAPAA